MSMPEHESDKKAIERFHALQEKRRQLMALEPQDAMERILKDSQPLPLVHSFPEQDFYFLIHDIGPEDALPLLALASDKQWDHIVDLETWHRDQIDMKSASRWLGLMLDADPNRFIRWFLDQKLEFIEFYLHKNIEVRVLEHDQDPSEIGSDFFSLDNSYFIRFVDQPVTDEADQISDDQRKKFLTKLIRYLADFDHRTYQHVMLEATHVLPAESEEKCYHWRNVRLAEKGFLPFDEAVGIYQPIKPQDIGQHRIGRPADGGARQGILPISQYPARLLKEDNHFTRALAHLAESPALPGIQAEFANLCNRIIVADHKTVRDRQALREIVQKACGFISLGLEGLVKDHADLDPRKAAELFVKYPLTPIFRVGFGRVLELKWQAEKWVDQSWFAGVGLRLTFWGEQWLGVLGGLLLKKPLYHDNYQTGVLYREFNRSAEIRETQAVFQQIQAMDKLLSLMTFQLAHPGSYGFLTYKNLILTLWARHYLNLPSRPLQAMALKDFKPFFDDLLPERPDSADAGQRSVPQEMKEHFLNWLAADTGLKEFEITEQLGETFEDLFADIESDLGRVAVQDLDPRYVQLFLLA
ncbi:MAG: hypothetical protein JRH12_26115 [Deltaproteobacteria bacterium]|jgi:hypothetical protein|nr:hypothetical protein [Deltaproteobacteria bacterium]